MTPPRSLPAFHTMRLIARQLEEDDIYSMQILHRNPDVMKYIHTPEKTLEETRATFTRVMTYPENHPEYGLWSVFLKDRSYTGWIILNHLDGTEDVEIGYRFLPDFWGMGYATEIATEIRNYAFQELDLPAIVGITLPENIASQRVLEKTGLTYRKPAYCYGVDVSFFQMGNRGGNKS